MIHSLYNFITSIILLIIKTFSFRKGKIGQWKKGQENVHKQYSNLKKNSIVFFIASSGEFEQAKPLIEKIKKEHPNLMITASFFSPSGYNQLKNNPLLNQVIYTPLDTVKNANEFVKQLQPKAAVFVKYELWLNLMTEMNKHNVPQFLVSAVFSESHFATKWFGKPWMKQLKQFQQIFVQDENSQKALAKTGLQAEIAGDTRIDRSLELPTSEFSDKILDSLSPEKTKLILGSAWQPDLDLFKELKPWLNENNLQLIIAPHELHQNFLDSIKKDFDSKTYSEGTSIGTKDLLIDKMGILKYAYRYADIAYIGGGFGKGIHNTLEPASYGIPVIFGPKHEKFVEATALIKNGGAFSVSDRESLQSVLESLLKGHVEAGEKAKQFLIKNAGATAKIYKEMATFLR